MKRNPDQLEYNFIRSTPTTVMTWITPNRQGPTLHLNSSLLRTHQQEFHSNLPYICWILKWKKIPINLPPGNAKNSFLTSSKNVSRFKNTLKILSEPILCRPLPSSDRPQSERDARDAVRSGVCLPLWTEYSILHVKTCLLTSPLGFQPPVLLTSFPSPCHEERVASRPALLRNRFRQLM